MRLRTLKTLPVGNFRINIGLAIGLYGVRFHFAWKLCERKDLVKQIAASSFVCKLDENILMTSPRFPRHIRVVRPHNASGRWQAFYRYPSGPETSAGATG